MRCVNTTNTTGKYITMFLVSECVSSTIAKKDHPVWTTTSTTRTNVSKNHCQWLENVAATSRSVGVRIQDCRDTVTTPSPTIHGVSGLARRQTTRGCNP
jgi:hypothetical protein